MWRVEREVRPEDVERLLRSLPDWFGIEESIVEYAADAMVLPGCSARDADGLVDGIALVARHFEESAELHLIAVDPAYHRRGVGLALLNAIEADLRALGVRLLQVHTVGPSFEHDGYARTRAFYAAQGFLPLQEVHDLDWPGPTLIQVKVLSTEQA